MISNNATVKLTSHEVDSESEVASKGQATVREGPEGDIRRPPFGSRESYNSRTVVSNKERDKTDFRPSSRSKYRDERMARGGSYRCSNARTNRSGGSYSSDSRKNKLFGDASVASQKYESIKDVSKPATGKLYEASDGGSKVKGESGTLSSDDCRISKVLRRLAREDDPEKFIILAKQLQVSRALLLIFFHLQLGFFETAEEHAILFEKLIKISFLLIR